MKCLTGASDQRDAVSLSGQTQLTARLSTADAVSPVTLKSSQSLKPVS